MKNRHWIMVFAGLIAALLLVWRLLPSGGQQVGIYQDGTLLRTVTLPYAGGTERFEIPGAAGGNIVELSREGIRVLQAGCPDQICVEHGFLEAGSGPVICLPNRLVIRFLEDSESAAVDAVSGGRGQP